MRTSASEEPPLSPCPYGQPPMTADVFYDQLLTFQIAGLTMMAKNLY